MKSKDRVDLAPWA